MNSRDITRSHAWSGPYRRPSTQRIRNWLFAAVFAITLAALAAARF